MRLQCLEQVAVSWNLWILDLMSGVLGSAVLHNHCLVNVVLTACHARQRERAGTTELDCSDSRLLGQMTHTIRQIDV